MTYLDKSAVLSILLLLIFVVTLPIWLPLALLYGAWLWIKSLFWAPTRNEF